MDITCDCAGELAMAKFPCKAINYGYPNKLLFLPPDGSMTVAGESPTLAEVQAAIAATGQDKLILIEEFTNGQRVESSREEETGADTADGLTTVTQVYMAITGRIKRLDESVIRDLLKTNCFDRLKMWVITTQGYIFGGKTGFTTSNFFTPLIMEGFGVAGYIPINHIYRHDQTKTDPAAQNDGFITLTNPATT